MAVRCAVTGVSERFPRWLVDKFRFRKLRRRSNLRLDLRSSFGTWAWSRRGRGVGDRSFSLGSGFGLSSIGLDHASLSSTRGRLGLRFLTWGRENLDLATRYLLSVGGYGHNGQDCGGECGLRHNGHSLISLMERR